MKFVMVPHWAKASLLGMAAAAFAASPRLTSALELKQPWLCTIVVLIWFSFTLLIAFYLYQSVQGVKAIFVPVLVKDEGVRRFLRRGFFAKIVSLTTAGVLAFSLFVFFVLASYWFVFLSLFVGSLVAVLSKVFAGINSKILQPRLVWLGARLGLTSAVVILLAGMQIAIFGLDPIYKDYGRLDQPEQYVIDHVHHDCRMVQHVARTAAYIDVTLWGLRKIEGFGPLLFVTSLALMFSLAPFLAWTIVVRTAVEIPLGVARYPASGGND